LRKRANKRKAKSKRQREEKEYEQKNLQRIKEEVFQTTKAIYIELLASRLLVAFRKSSESFGEEKNI
jgi:hypothetical protein